MTVALATPADLATMWRPLLPDETSRAADLLLRASALLRQAVPSIDDRIAQWTSSDDVPVGALDPTLVATVVATIVKRFIANVEGVASESIGPYSVSYALRTEKDVRGELQVTANDLRALRPYQPKAALGSIRVHPSMAPWPIGDLGIVARMRYDTADYQTGTEPVSVPTPVVVPSEVL